MAGMEEFQDAVSCEGSSEARAKLRVWLSAVAKSIEVEGDVPLELHAVGKGSDGCVYATGWDISESIEDVINEIVDAAEQEAMDIGRGTVRFKVIVEKNQKMGRGVFTLTIPKSSDLSMDDMEDIDELATQKGLLSQLMRHQEKTMKVGLGGSAKLQETLMRMCESKDRRITELEERTVELAKTYEELLSGKHARDLEYRKLDNDERRKEQVAGILMQSVPLLLNKFMTGRALPESTTASAQSAMPSALGDKPFNEPVTPLENMLEGFLQSFTPPQLNQIMVSGIFTPPQMMTFVEIAKVVQARMQAREEQAKKAHEAQAKAAQNGGSHASAGAAPYIPPPPPPL